MCYVRSCFWNRLGRSWVPETEQPSLSLSVESTTAPTDLPSPDEVYLLLLKFEGNGGRVDHPYGVSSLVFAFASLLSVSWRNVVCNLSLNTPFCSCLFIIRLWQATMNLHVLIYPHSTALPLVMPTRSGSMMERECWHRTVSVKIVLHFCHPQFQLCWSCGTETTT